MSLYIKYRPTGLDQVRGNESVISTLKKMLINIETCPHVFLLHGPTGCGKTTIARIISNELQCKDDDIIELNTADVRGIDTIREIIQNSRFMPMVGTNRIWIIDECHKLTGDAQNALLKVLEDTPKHVYFVLCTTDPQKLIATIKGRCIQFPVKPLTGAEIQGLVRSIARQEGHKLEVDILEQIAQDSLGHPRNALQILEQVLNTEPDKRLEVARQTAALQSQTIELCRALIQRSGWKTIRTILSGLTDQEPESIRRAVMGYCQAVLLKDDNDVAGLILEHMIEPFYDSGWSGLVYKCYLITKNK